MSRALRRSIYYAQEEYDKLPETVQKAVGGPEMLRRWAEADMQSIESVIQSHFVRTYRQEIARSRERRKVPQDTLEGLEQSDNKLLEKK